MFADMDPGLNIIGGKDWASFVDAGMSLSPEGGIIELGASWLETGAGVNIAGGAIGILGGAPFGTIAGALTGLAIPDHSL